MNIKPKSQSIPFLLPLLLLITVSFNISAQTADSVLKTSQVKLNFKPMGLGGSYERRVSKSFTLFSEAGIRTANGMYLSRYEPETGWGIINAELGVEGRYYYNLKKRALLNKKTANNSANFLSFSANYGFKPFTNKEYTIKDEVVIDGNRYIIEFPVEKSSLLSIAPIWGIQRMVGSAFSFETMLGGSLNYFGVNKDWELAPVLGFRFGLILK